MLDHFKELLAPRGAIRSRAMFGGHGIYCDDFFIAIVVDDQLYLKVDGLTQAAFAEAGSSAFVYSGKGKPVAMSYWLVPDAALESARAMRPWADMAIAAAQRKTR
jgi:DNA transformation protein